MNKDWKERFNEEFIKYGFSTDNWDKVITFIEKELATAREEGRKEGLEQGLRRRGELAERMYDILSKQ